MEKNKEGRRKSAKKVDYNLMLLHAQKLQEGAEYFSLGWGLLELGWAGVRRWRGLVSVSLLYFLRRGRVLSKMPLKECAGMIYTHGTACPAASCQCFFGPQGLNAMGY